MAKKPTRIDGDTSRQHGVDFERLIRSTPSYDIPTSVKTAGGGVIVLGDAARFYDIDFPCRIVIGTWKQTDDRQKTFTAIHECVIPTEVMAAVRGDMSGDEIRRIQQDVQVAPADQGPEGVAVVRRVAMDHATAMRDRTGIVQVGFKIDAHNRRMHATLRLSDLQEVLERQKASDVGGAATSLHTVHRASYRGLSLPISIESPARRDPGTMPPQDRSEMRKGEVADDRHEALLKAMGTP